MSECFWYEECPFKDECTLCCNGNDFDEEFTYLSRESFYKDWFNYVGRENN